MKNKLFLVFYLLAGVVLGGLLANLCTGVPALSWLSYSQTIGISPTAPFVLDLAVVKLSIGFCMSVSVAQIFTIGLALFIYYKTR